MLFFVLVDFNVLKRECFQKNTVIKFEKAHIINDKKTKMFEKITSLCYNDRGKNT